jgi:hypothetical protein
VTTRSPISRTDATEVAADAFVFGYPLVLSDRVRRWMTDVRTAQRARMKAPMNEFVHARELPEATATGVPAPHADTLRSSAWLDLGDGPVVLTVPETHGRFYAMSMVDLWTNVFASVGARTTGCSSGAFTIAGPYGSGAGLPGTVPIGAPTRAIRIAGLTMVDGDGRVAEAHAIQDGFRLGPARGSDGAGGRRDRPAAERPAGRTPPVGQVERMSAQAFFAELSRLMGDNPPRLEDRPIVERMRSAGLLLASDDAWDTLPREVRSAVQRGGEQGLDRVLAAAEAPPGDAVGDWHIRFRLGEFGTDYLSRAAAACAGLEAGPAADELPALLRCDADGRPLLGRRRYVLRFPPSGQPPVHGLWTLTTYDDRQPLVDNPVDRYSIGDWNGLTLDSDGSLPIQIQHRRPSDAERSNWLPAPPGTFNLLLRLIWPQEDVLEGTWKPPPVVRTG